MITFDELFEDPHAKELIYHIVDTAFPNKENRSWVRDKYTRDASIELVLVAPKRHTMSDEQLNDLIYDAGFTAEDCYFVTSSNSFPKESVKLTKGYITNPEVLVHKQLLQLFKNIFG